MAAAAPVSCAESRRWIGAGPPTRSGLLVGAALLLSACTSHPVRTRPIETIEAREVYLPAGAKPGMFVTWSVETTDAEVRDAVEETIACVEETEGVVTIERRETWGDGSRLVTASRHRRDGTLLGAWRAFEGGIGAPLRVVDTAAEWRSQVAGTDALRKRFGLPMPDVSTSQVSEWVETPAGRIHCSKHVVEASLLVYRVRFTTWHARSPFPLSPLVKIEATGPRYRMSRMLRAYGFEGAKPTLTIPPSGS